MDREGKAASTREWALFMWAYILTLCLALLMRCPTPSCPGLLIPPWQRPRGLCATVACMNISILILLCSPQLRLSRSLWWSWAHSKSQIRIVLSDHFRLSETLKCSDCQQLWTLEKTCVGLELEINISRSFGFCFGVFFLLLFHTCASSPNLINSLSYISSPP